MRVIEVEQGTRPWLQAKAGRMSSSRMADVMTKPKVTSKGTTRGGITELAGRRAYRAELVCERLTGVSSEHHVTRPMQWGIDNEPFARSAYEVAEDAMVDTVGFVLHPTMDFAGASPDGLVGDDGCLEIKCPTSENFLDWRDAGVAPEEHIHQMQWVMACCERDWCDFVAFDPRMPNGLRFFIVRVERDEKRIAGMEFEVIHLHDEVEKKRLSLSPGHIWAPPMPRAAREEMVSVGNLSIPADLAEMLDRSELVP